MILTDEQALGLAHEAARMQGMMQDSHEAAGFAQFLSGRDVSDILELGTCSGGTMYLMDRACRPGLRISMDRLWTERDPKDAIGHLEGFRKNLPNVVEILGDIHAPEQQRRLEEFLAGRKLDLMFIDSDHSYEGGKKHWEMYSQFVAQGKYVAWHDIRDGWPVGRFYDELCKTYPHWEFVNLPNCYGIGVFQI